MPRATRQIDAIAGLVATNSPMLVGSHEPRVDGGKLSFLYSFLVQNTGAKPANIALDEAVAGTRAGPTQPRCSVNGYTMPKFALMAGDKRKIDCKVELSVDATIAAGRTDADVVLGIPVQTEAGDAVLRFGYRLRIEDAL
jgi:hypothetical protein